MHRTIAGAFLGVALASCGGETPPAAPPPAPPPNVTASTTAPPPTPAALTARPRRQLTVALYPYVPHREVMFADAKTAFENVHPDVEVIQVDLFDHYYKSNSKKNDSIIQTSANVMEIDSVFLNDLADHLVALPASAAPRESDFAEAAVQAARKDGVWLGSPHWLCSDFVFTTKAKPFTGSSLKALEQFVGRHPKDGSGLLADIMGASTLGEFYLDEVVDRTGTLARGMALLPKLPLADDWKAPPPELENIKRLLGLCDSQNCRRNDYHNLDNLYPSDFAHKKGVALVGYSEDVYGVLHALKDSTCAPSGSCISADDLVVAALPLADEGVHPFVWVDMLAVNKMSCTDACVADAAGFIAMMNDDAHLKADLLTALDAPRYLLPAKVTLDAELRAKTSLYEHLRALTQRAPPAMGPHLGDTLRAVGEKVDRQLPQPNH